MKINKLIATLFLGTLMVGCHKERYSTKEGAYTDPTTVFSDSDGSGVTNSPNGNPNTPLPAGVITAGEWNDLEHWDFWLNLQQDPAYSAYSVQWGFFPFRRISLSLTNFFNKPVVDHPVSLMYAGSTHARIRTDNKGRADLWASMFNAQDIATENYLLSVPGGVNVPTTLPFFPTHSDIKVAGVLSPPTKVQIAMVVDATGSMGDEIEYLKVELKDVLERAAADLNGGSLECGSVFYRDEGDDYVTKISPFSADIKKTVQFVGNQSADGGGDFPEAVHAALETALNDLSWDYNAKTRLLFLLLDAPPHETQEIKQQMRNLTEKAMEKGVRIIPVTASGIDKSTEFLMRYLALATNGTYVFITNHSGIGDNHIKATVGDYEVEYLNNLLVRLIHKYTE
jgi:hypothetical protein